MKKIILSAALLLLVAAPVHAWGPRGHRLVGHVAESALTPAARAEVEALLEGVEDPELRSLAGISTWADELRAHDPDLGRRSARWHYVNIGENECRYQREDHCPDGKDCVVEAINDQAAILGDRSRSSQERLQALKFVVHFVGDVHQPMHAGYAHDRGGNSTQVNLRDGSRDGFGTNLHALWDSGLFRGLEGGEEEHLANLPDLPAGADLETKPARWAEESCRVVVGQGVTESGTKIGPDYVGRWRPVAEARIVIGGRRLAELLNEVLGSGR